MVLWLRTRAQSTWAEYPRPGETCTQFHEVLREVQLWLVAWGGEGLALAGIVVTAQDNLDIHLLLKYGLTLDARHVLNVR